jgi:hypothetical protein
LYRWRRSPVGRAAMPVLDWQQRGIIFALP